MNDLTQDLRYTLRSLRRSPGFTAMVVVSLALGIGANTAIFTVVNAFLLRELPVRDPQGVVLFGNGLSMGRVEAPARGALDLYSYPLFQRLVANNRAFADLAAEDSLRTGAVVRWTGPADESSANFAFRRWVSPNYFALLGVPAHRGRTFTAQEAAAQADPVVVISHEYWQRRFAGDPAVVGARVTINRRPHVVVGIAPPGFVGLDVGSPTDLWAPFSGLADDFDGGRALLEKPQTRWLNVLGRLAPGATMAAAEGNVNGTLQQFLSDEPLLAREAAGRAAIRIVLQPGATGASGLREGFRGALLVLMCGVALLLFIVCLNLSHLLLARATQREREMSIRTALGASRGRLARQLLTEGLVLALLGAGLGALMRGWLSDALVTLAMSGQPTYMPLLLDTGADARVLAFTASLAVATALVLGLVPAWRAARTQPQQALRATSTAVAGGGARRLASRILLVSQVAFSVVLVVAAGLLTSSLGRLRGADRGFDEDHLLLVRISTEFAGLGHAQALVLQDELLRRVTALPGVRAASLSYAADLPGGGMFQLASVKDGEPLPAPISTVSWGYFETVGMTMTRGRGFTREDNLNAPRVAVVNETLARRLFGGVEAVGKRFRLASPSAPTALAQAPELEVVGVLQDVRLNPRTLRPQPLGYVPAAQSSNFVGALEVRTFGDPAALADQVRRTVLEVNPNLPVRNVRTMRAQLERLLMRERFMSTLAGGFGLAALFLVCVGLYGVIALWGAQRTREIGVRMALGATTTGVRWMVLRQALVLVLAGVVVGIPAAIAVAQTLKGFLYGVTPMDPRTLAVAGLAMFAVALLAAYLPARRASRVDPMVALRSE